MSPAGGWVGGGWFVWGVTRTTTGCTACLARQFLALLAGSSILVLGKKDDAYLLAAPGADIEEDADAGFCQAVMPHQ